MRVLYIEENDFLSEKGEREFAQLALDLERAGCAGCLRAATRARVAAAFPNWRRDAATVKLQNTRSLGWNFGYLPELADLTLDPPSSKYVWVLEADVAWTGSLVSALATWDTERADLLCQWPTYKNKHWDHFPERSPGWPKRERAVRSCYVFAARFGARLLEAMARDTRAGHFAYSELFVGTACSTRWWWCRDANFMNRRAALGPPAMRGAEFAVAGVGYVGILNASEWARRASNESLLYHPVKF